MQLAGAAAAAASVHKPILPVTLGDGSLAFDSTAAQVEVQHSFWCSFLVAGLCPPTLSVASQARLHPATLP